MKNKRIFFTIIGVAVVGFLSFFAYLHSHAVVKRTVTSRTVIGAGKNIYSSSRAHEEYHSDGYSPALYTYNCHKIGTLSNKNSSCNIHFTYKGEALIGYKCIISHTVHFKPPIDRKEFNDQCGEGKTFPSKGKNVKGYRIKTDVAPLVYKDSTYTYTFFLDYKKGSSHYEYDTYTLNCKKSGDY